MSNKNSTPDADAGKKQPSGAPELDVAALADNERQEVEQAFSNREDADVVTELSDDSKTDAAGLNEVDIDDDQPAASQPLKPAGASNNPFARLGRSYWKHKKWAIPLTVLAIAAGALALPATRYPILANFIERDVSLLVIDDGTKQPVASAAVVMDGQRVVTDNEGNATFKVRVGDRPVTVSKKYYSQTDVDIFVAVKKASEPTRIYLKATGRQVPLVVTNKLTGKPIEDALIKASGTEVKTDKDGKATLVLPAGKAKLAVEVSGTGYHGAKAELVVTEKAVPENSFQLTPNGKIYFLSKRSGKIDVVKTNLDGGERQTIVAGTGREEDRNTVLLASRDWKYLAMLSRRDSDKPKIYLIDTAAEKMTVMDEGDASFELVGWSDSNFVYKVTRNSYKAWQPGQQVIKSFNATNAKISVLDQSKAEGDQNNYNVQNLGNVYLLADRAIYTTQWSSNSYYAGSNGLAGKANNIFSVSITGQNRKDLKSFPSDKYYNINARLYEPREIYFSVYSSTTSRQEFYEYESGVIKPAAVDENDFFTKTYPTYLNSPSGKRVFWSEQRDGRDTFFTGNDSIEDLKQVAVLDEHQVYGWYNDDYLLVSKKGSELYVLPSAGGPVTKITDYHRPNVSFRGYGGGYGGL